MEERRLGTTGLKVSVVGLGAGKIGGPDMSDADVDRLVGCALDLGVTIIDTAPSYGASEERLGRALAGRRDRVALSTKLGYGVPGVPDWTPECITAGVDAALVRLRTDHLDVAHLHSCERDTAERTSGALAAAVRAGKVRVAAYSGENEALAWAVASGRFGVVQCSVSVVDQGELDGALAAGLGVLGKRPLGNAPWRFAARPAEPDVAEAWDRSRALGLEAEGLETYARFAAHAPGVSAILVGTVRAEHLREVAAAVALGPLPAERSRSLRDAWGHAAARWRGRT
jgi:aryl-alcohol dehydrogenase-like predicted oxidoreductase